MFALTATLLFAALSAVAGAAIEPRTDQVTAWVTAGCYTDNVQRRALPDEFVGSSVSMTIEFCLNFCAKKGLAYSGLEYGGECFCSNSIKNDHVPAESSDCKMPCTGDLTETCGAGDRLSLYHNIPNTNAVVVQQALGWTHDGCYTDYSGGRTLPFKAQKLFGDWTVETCVTTCSLEGFTFSGLEFGNECYCGSEIAASATFVANTQCNFVCAGNYAQFCGGPNRLNVYKTSLSIPL